MADSKYEMKKALQYILTMMNDKMFVKQSIINIYRWHQAYCKSLIKFTWLSKKEEQEHIDFEEFYKISPKDGLKIAGRFLEAIKKKSLTQKIADSQFTYFENQLKIFQHIFSLSEQEKALLEIMICYQTNSLFEQFVDHVYDHELGNKKMVKLYCQCLKITPQTLQKLLAPENKLVKNNLIEVAYYDNSSYCSPFCLSLLNNGFSNREELQRLFLKAPLTTDLNWDDFQHIEHIHLVRKLFYHLHQQSQTGINILLHGDVGTGKTEFAKVLCQETHFNLYSIEGNEKLLDNRTRFDDLALVQNLLAYSQHNCLLIDEADDIFQQYCISPNRINKITINKALESNLTPVIWIMNEITQLEPAYLRRFNYIFEFTKPTEATRQKIWQKTFQKHNIQVDDAIVIRCAKDSPVPPSVIESAIKTTKLAQGGINEIQQQIQLLQKALYPNDQANKLPSQNEQFDPLLLNTDFDLIKLTERLKKSGKRHFSLCLYGVSGTGKSAYAHYLANTLDMPIIKKQCADLLSMWVGGTEKNITNAFKEAQQQQAILLFDEADSFLQDRQFAQQSWEVTQVNQMLTCMEAHSYPFICTTNLIGTLDQASLRRFTFKINYDFMTKEQLQYAFKFFFNLEALSIPHLPTATVGDFIVVKHKAEYLDCLTDPNELIYLLKQEQINKPQPKAKIGFR